MDATVLLCDVQSEQSWERCLTTKANGCSDIKMEIVVSRQAIAKSKTAQDLQKNWRKCAQQLGGKTTSVQK